MRSKAIRTLGFVLLTVCVGCAGSRGVQSSNNPNLITRAEIVTQQDRGVRDLYELVSRVRPRWLQVRGERSMHLATTILVYQNTTRLGDLEAMRGYPLEAITSIRYLDSAQAGQLPGAGSAHIQGAIVISTEIRGSRQRQPTH